MVDDTLWLSGGRRESYGLEKDSLESTGEVWCFDPKTGQWTGHSPSPYNFGHALAVDADGDVFVIGTRRAIRRLLLHPIHLLFCWFCRRFIRRCSLVLTEFVLAGASPI